LEKAWIGLETLIVIDMQQPPNSTQQQIVGGACRTCREPDLPSHF